jgi:thiamine-phosphate pyrophosphorylase
VTGTRNYLRLYLVTDRDLARGRSLREVISAAVDGGVTAVQVREKELGTRRFLNEVRALMQLLEGSGVPLFVNDRADVAIAAGAAGLHVGQDDLPAEVARELVGPGMRLGVSVGTPAEARAALAAGADYVSVSPVFLTPTKPDADSAVGLEGVRRVRQAAGEAPVLAIGGIDGTNAASVIAAGADGVSVVSAIMSAEDPSAAAAALSREVSAGLDARRPLP